MSHTTFPDYAPPPGPPPGHPSRLNNYALGSGLTDHHIPQVGFHSQAGSATTAHYYSTPQYHQQYFCHASQTPGASSLMPQPPTILQPQPRRTFAPTFQVSGYGVPAQATHGDRSSALLARGPAPGRAQASPETIKTTNEHDDEQPRYPPANGTVRQPGVYGRLPPQPFGSSTSMPQPSSSSASQSQRTHNTHQASSSATNNAPALPRRGSNRPKTHQEITAGWQLSVAETPSVSTPYSSQAGALAPALKRRPTLDYSPADAARSQAVPGSTHRGKGKGKGQAKAKASRKEKKKAAPGSASQSTSVAQPQPAPVPVAGTSAAVMPSSTTYFPADSILASASVGPSAHSEFFKQATNVGATPVNNIRQMGPAVGKPSPVGGAPYPPVVSSGNGPDIGQRTAPQVPHPVLPVVSPSRKRRQSTDGRISPAKRARGDLTSENVTPTAILEPLRAAPLSPTKSLAKSKTDDLFGSDEEDIDEWEEAQEEEDPRDIYFNNEQTPLALSTPGPIETAAPRPSAIVIKGDDDSKSNANANIEVSTSTNLVTAFDHNEFGMAELSLLTHATDGSAASLFDTIPSSLESEDYFSSFSLSV